MASGTQNPIMLYTVYVQLPPVFTRTDRYSGTPNGYKISILLEELGLKYDFQGLSFQKNEQKVYYKMRWGFII
jgi:hypothetical protein